jgi:hypothetical protein
MSTTRGAPNRAPHLLVISGATGNFFLVVAPWLQRVFYEVFPIQLVLNFSYELTCECSGGGGGGGGGGGCM